MVIITFRPPVILFLYLYIVMIARFIIGPNENTWWPLFIIIFLVYLPISVYRRAMQISMLQKHFMTRCVMNLPPHKLLPQAKPLTALCNGQPYTTFWNWSNGLLYCNRQTAMIIPKSSFESPQDLETFRRMSMKLVPKQAGSFLNKR
jgi:hypothetical protein